MRAPIAAVRAQLARRSKAPRPRLAVEIGLALGVKAVLLYVLWAAWFSHPSSKALNERRVAAALLGEAATAQSKSESPRDSRP